MKHAKKLLLLILCFVMSLAAVPAQAKTTWDGAVWDTNGDASLAPIVENEILWLPVLHILTQNGIEAVENEGVLSSGGVTVSAGSAVVNNNGILQIATLSPRLENGVLYAPQRLIERIFPVSVKTSKDGSVSVTAAGERAEDDDSWFYELGGEDPVPEDNTGLTNADIVEKNVRASLYNSTGKPAVCWDSMLPDGSFPDLDYSDKDMNAWDPGTHASRCKELTKIIYTPTNPLYKDPEYKEKLRKSLEFWFKGNFVGSAWWNNRGVTVYFQDMGVFELEDIGLEEATLTELYRRQKGYDSAPHEFYFDAAANGLKPSGVLRPYYGTGQGIPTRVLSSLKMVAADPTMDAETKQAKLEECIKGLSYELTLEVYSPKTNPTGSATNSIDIMEDWSYHEHGDQNLTTTYGASFLCDLYQCLAFLNGCDLKLTDEAALALRNLLLDGFRYMWKNNYAGWLTGGRQFSLPASTGYSQTLCAAKIVCCEYLIKNYPEMDRKDELLDYRRMASLAGDGEHFDGSRFFWQSDLLAHNRKEQDYLFNLNVISNRLTRPEQANDSNTKGQYMGNGCYEILKSGNEYWGLGPVMNWWKLAGVTAAQDETFNMSPRDPKTGMTSFCGGVADGQYGFAVFDLNQHDVVAKKAYFAFDDEIVCIGAGIESNNANDVFTSFNQCKLNGEVITDQGAVTEDAVTLNGAKWILHDGIGYAFELDSDEQFVEIEKGSKTGSWSFINNEEPDSHTETYDVFLAGINHGEKPEQETYHYAILPSADEDFLNDYVEDKPYEIAANTAEQQAVYHKDLGILMAGFYKPGTVTASNGQSITVDKPCVVMLRTYKDGSYQVTVSNPECTKLKVAVSLSGPVSTSLEYDLQEGAMGNDGGKPVMYDSTTGEFYKDRVLTAGVDAEFTELAEAWAIAVDDKILTGNIYSWTHSTTLTIDKLPEVRAKGNFPAHIDTNEERTVISIIDPDNPNNRADYRILYKWKEPETEATK